MAYVPFLSKYSSKPGKLPESHMALFEFFMLNFVTFCENAVARCLYHRSEDSLNIVINAQDCINVYLSESVNYSIFSH